jgi:CubicO group peptidase (beta-lactamase class C family)
MTPEVTVLPLPIKPLPRFQTIMTKSSSAHYIACLIAIISMLAATVAAQGSRTAEVDKFVNAEMQKFRIPGLSVAVVQKGQVVLVKGYGLANVEHKVPVKPETIFQSGSVGKQFTATAVMMLVEDGKIGLEEKISKYLGDVPEAWKNITVRHLLTHTSGMTGYPGDFDFRRDHSEDELLKKAQAVPLAFQPGDKWLYSNLGYVTLGILISKVTGKFYGEFLTERIFKPAGMTTASIISEADIVPDRAAGYRIEKGQLKNQHWVAPTTNTTADGSLYLSVLDMVKWEAVLNGEKLLKKATLEQMWTPVKLNDGKLAPYGFGWMLRRVNGGKLIEHGGAWQGFKSYIARYVDKGTTVIILANLADMDPGQMAVGVAGVYHPDLAPPPVAPIEDKEPQFTAKVKELIQAFINEKADKDLFTKELQDVVFPTAKDFSEFLKSHGSFNKVVLIERRDEDDDRIYRYQLIFQNSTKLLMLKVNKDGKIADIQLRPA